MMDDLTNPQTRALSYISSVTEKSGTAPTLRELCAHMGYRAIGSAQDLVAALRKKGYLVAPEKQTARALLLTRKARSSLSFAHVIESAGDVFQVPCLGSVPAGNPLEAVEERIDTMQISASLLPRPKPKAENLFAVQTQGLSMIGAGILDGDWLVVNCQSDSEPGSIVIARVEGDVTCKRLMHDLKSGWFLKPENPDFPNIKAKDMPFEIVGKVVALQRSVG